MDSKREDFYPNYYFNLFLDNRFSKRRNDLLPKESNYIFAESTIIFHGYKIEELGKISKFEVNKFSMIPPENRTKRLIDCIKEAKFPYSIQGDELTFASIFTIDIKNMAIWRPNEKQAYSFIIEWGDDALVFRPKTNVFPIIICHRDVYNIYGYVHNYFGESMGTNHVEENYYKSYENYYIGYRDFIKNHR